MNLVGLFTKIKFNGQEQWAVIVDHDKNCVVLGFMVGITPVYFATRSQPNSSVKDIYTVYAEDSYPREWRDVPKGPGVSTLTVALDFYYRTSSQIYNSELVDLSIKQKKILPHRHAQMFEGPYPSKKYLKKREAKEKERVKKYGR